MSGWKKVLLCAGFVFLLLFIVCMFFWISARREYKETVADLREKKWLLTAEELRAKYPPSPEEQLLLWGNAIAELSSNDRGMRELTQKHLTAENAMECRIALLDHPEFLRKMDALAGIRELRFSHTWEDGSFLNIPSIASIRELANVNAIRTEFAAQDGRWDECKKYILFSRTLREIAGSETFLISGLVANSLEHVHIRTLQKIILAGGLPHFESSFLRELIAEAEAAETRCRNNMPEILKTELSLSDITFRKFIAPMRIYLSTPHGLREHAFLLKALSEHIENGSADFFTLTFSDHHTASKKKYYFFIQLLLPEKSSFFQNASTMYASQRSLRTALAAELYRRKYGAFPEALQKLVPEFFASIPIDPFTGKELLYRNSSDGIAVYSTGKDKIDNGGVSDATTHYDKDIVFSIPGNVK